MILNVIQWSVSSYPLKLVLLHVIKNPTDRAGQSWVNLHFAGLALLPPLAAS